jgi:hypothetical protein
VQKSKLKFKPFYSVARLKFGPILHFSKFSLWTQLAGRCLCKLTVYGGGLRIRQCSFEITPASP